MSSAKDNKQQIKYKVYLKDKLDSKNLASSSGNSPFQIIEYSSKEVLGGYPSFNMVLLGNDFFSLVGIDDCIVEFISQDISYKIKSCIIYKDFSTSEGKIFISGYFAEKKLCLDVNTKFLGNDINTAISSLGFNQKVISKNNSSLQLYQINETCVNCLIKLCDMDSDFPFWSIGINEIILTKSNERKSYYPMSYVINVIETSIPNIQDFSSSIDDVYYFDIINNYNLFGNKNNESVISRVTKNYLFRHKHRPTMVMNGGVNMLFPYKLGDIFDNNLVTFKNVSFWQVSSVVRNFNVKGEVSTDLQYISY